MTECGGRSPARGGGGGVSEGRYSRRGKRGEKCQSLRRKVNYYCEVVLSLINWMSLSLFNVLLFRPCLLHKLQCIVSIRVEFQGIFKADARSKRSRWNFWLKQHLDLLLLK